MKLKISMGQDVGQRKETESSPASPAGQSLLSRVNHRPSIIDNFTSI